MPISPCLCTSTSSFSRWVTVSLSAHRHFFSPLTYFQSNIQFVQVIYYVVEVFILEPVMRDKLAFAPMVVAISIVSNMTTMGAEKLYTVHIVVFCWTLSDLRRASLRVAVDFRDHVLNTSMDDDD